MAKISGKIFSDRKVPKTGPHPLSMFDLTLWVFVCHQMLELFVFPSETLLCLALSVTSYVLFVSVWRLYLSPLRHIPGPPLGIITYWYEFWYDVWPGIGQVSLFYVYNEFPVFGGICLIKTLDLLVHQ